MMAEKTQDRYQKLGFKCGLEFHQELETGKLFCPCSSALTEGAETRTVVRKLRAVAGELGEVDPAAQFEMFRDSILVVSYRSDGVPTVDRLAGMLRDVKRHVRVIDGPPYQYALSTNRRTREVLLIGTDSAR